jgi:hypothetical protein
VLNRGAVSLISDDRFDVTDEALKRLDVKLPTMTVTVAEPAAPTAAAPPPPAKAPAKKK